jgi:hypothetical protein
MWGPIARHISIVTGLAGSLAAIIPGVLFWPRLAHPLYSGSLVQYYLLEMGMIGVTVLVILLMRASWVALAVWAASGLTAAFSIAAGFTIGTLYVPAGVLFAISGILGDLSQPRSFFRHLPIAAAAGAFQLGVMALVVLRLTSGAD